MNDDESRERLKDGLLVLIIQFKASLSVFHDTYAGTSPDEIEKMLGAELLKDPTVPVELIRQAIEHDPRQWTLAETRSAAELLTQRF